MRCLRPRPPPFGPSDGKGLISIAEGVGKMRAAQAGRRDPNLVIAGRTGALALSSVEDTIARMKAYEAAGVDVVFLSGAKTRAQIDAVAGQIKIPLLLGGVTGEQPDARRADPILRMLLRLDAEPKPDA